MDIPHEDKSETSSIFNMISTQFQSNIQVLRTNNARDYFNSTLGSFISSHAILTLVHMWTLLNKMGLPKGKIDTFLRSLVFL